ncbi:MAG: flavin-dependent oxidoreductase [Mesorhizobium amorphae]|nr:MAG: flavin-dependent oxidoreductase [Mesorhizobium amorphae]
MKAIIAGGGIGGLTTALSLHRMGITCEIHEQVPELRELGVGITLMPHAVAELAELGLLPDLDAVAIRSEHLHYVTKLGQTVWSEPRGLAAGQPVPQFFIHRGHLQSLLHRAVERALPLGTIRLGHRLSGFTQDAGGVSASFVDPSGRPCSETHGDILIGADGIHSVTRQAVAPGEGPALWSGLMLWRGAADWPAFLGGASLLISGGVDAKFVSYPIAPGETPETRLTNWAAIFRLAPFGSSPPSREHWSREGRRADLMPRLNVFQGAMVDYRALVDATPVFWEFPMCDRNPIDHWSHGRVTLLGDAAHPMYPMGANGASQAILDARCLADCLQAHADPEEALRSYERERLPVTSEIVRRNRTGGPEGVIDAVEERAPQGFEQVDQVLPYETRRAIVRGYGQLAATGSSASTAPAA